MMQEPVTKVAVSKEQNTATITMDKHISLSTLQSALEDKYVITAQEQNETLEQTKTWLETYKPLLLIFGFIAVITLLVEFQSGEFNSSRWMGHFMAGFFLTFSFFKLLNLKGFAESYVMYDVIAKRFKIWAYLYAFVELALGLAYLVNFNPLVTNILTFTVMSISIVGVLQSVLNKRKIQCACLGDVFKLPMSTVTIIEDAIMIVMSGYMILQVV